MITRFMRDTPLAAIEIEMQSIKRDFKVSVKEVCFRS
ncbi:hypothetical protein EV214_11918 [Marinisporobacter balticus]|uniref:Uncharacterized protein n=1 Tax=Marinisporobacter balticus TaxID=2018667 RepID=A0A4R2KZL1_9FIRM|nr:hypothetical protein EV214_11918 [Marinisporobacter balticus]